MRKKGIAVGIILVTVVCGMLDACGVNSEPSVTLVEEDWYPNDSESNVSIQNGQNTGNVTGQNANGIPKCYPVCETNQTVSCAEQPFYKLGFGAGGQHIYICGSRAVDIEEMGTLGDDTYFIGVVDVADDSTDGGRMEELDLDMPKDMRVLRMKADSDGNAHLLWVSRSGITLVGKSEPIENFDYVKSAIMVINPEGEVLKNIDVSEVFTEEKGLALCFTVDAAGNYYWEKGADIIKLSPDGELLERIECLGDVHSIAQGKSGEMYAVCLGADRKEMLCRLTEEGLTETALIGNTPEALSLYPDMGAGTDTELLFLHRDGGIYAVDVIDGEAVFTLRVPEDEMPVSGQDISGCDILGDGRVCLYQYTEEGSYLYYMAAGR